MVGEERFEIESILSFFLGTKMFYIFGSAEKRSFSCEPKGLFL